MLRWIHEIIFPPDSPEPDVVEINPYAMLRHHDYYHHSFKETLTYHIPPCNMRGQKQENTMSKKAKPKGKGGKGC